MQSSTRQKLSPKRVLKARAVDFFPKAQSSQPPPHTLVKSNRHISTEDRVREPQLQT